MNKYCDRDGTEGDAALQPEPLNWKDRAAIGFSLAIAGGYLFLLGVTVYAGANWLIDWVTR